MLATEPITLLFTGVTSVRLGHKWGVLLLVITSEQAAMTSKKGPTATEPDRFVQNMHTGVEHLRLLHRSYGTRTDNIDSSSHEHLGIGGPNTHIYIYTYMYISIYI